MSRTWSFVDSDGSPTGATFSGPAAALAANTPDGCRAVEGLLEVAPRADPELIRSRILSHIDALQRMQLRALTELAANPDDAAAKRFFAERQEKIAALRLQLTG
jgi:hypothetical protein